MKSRAAQWDSEERAMRIEDDAAVAEDEGIGLRTSRRGFLKGMGLAAGAAALLPAVGNAQEDAHETPGLKELGRGEREITLKINGESRKLKVEPRTTLLEALRVKLDLTGAKEICDRGACGGCTVLVGGKSLASCLLLAMDAQGEDVVTVEGIAKDPRYSNLIDAFCEHDGAQCGYCIPGIVVRSAEFLAATPNPSPDEMRAGLAGNICRCGTYSKIFESMAACSAKGGIK